jgi:hypothetical protein
MIDVLDMLEREEAMEEEKKEVTAKSDVTTKGKEVYFQITPTRGNTFPIYYIHIHEIDTRNYGISCLMCGY